MCTPRRPGGSTGSTGVGEVELPEASFSPPVGLDPVATLEDHLAVGWEHDVEVVIDAPLDAVDALPLPRPGAARTALTLAGQQADRRSRLGSPYRACA
jgi:hypothetical protein